MEKKEKRKICGLIIRLIAGEAREINIAQDTRKVCRKYNQTTQKVDIAGIKRELTDFLRENNLYISTKAVENYALKYLREHEAIATANPSYRILREQIERGEYDFSFVESKT